VPLGHPDILAIFREALQACSPRQRLQEASLQDLLHELASRPGALRLAGAGKAFPAMAAAVEEVLGERLLEGYGVAHEVGGARLERVRVALGGHPLPDERSLIATEQLCHFLARGRADDPLLFVLSGGTSALLERLPAGVTLADLRRLNQCLLGSGLPIESINQVRQAVSCVKGGGLARWLASRACTVLVMSDVVGEPLGVVGSGPLWCEMSPLEGPTREERALDILTQADLLGELPRALLQHLRRSPSGALAPESRAAAKLVASASST
jgi:glycerate 2-kinase